MCRWRWVVLALYAAVVLVVMVFHEPWFDEAQAWLIARDSPWWDMVAVRPHYEGHPPLWWLLLAVPAKLGVPYEIGMKTVQFVCAMLMAWMLVCRAPFAKAVVALLPFTYFFGYQYGVTARPYALLCAALFLVAEQWRERNRHPWRLACSMALLCLTSSYGVAIAGSMAAIWVLRTWRSRDGSLLRDRRRLGAWGSLLVLGLALTVEVWPAADNFAIQASTVGPMSVMVVAQRLAVFWLVLPAESLVTGFVEDTALRWMGLGVTAWVVCTVISLAMWAAMLHVARRRGNMVLLLLPYAALSAVAMRYFSGHHIGVLLALFIAVLWVNASERPLGMDDVPSAVRRVIRPLPKADARRVMALKAVAVAALLGVSVAWNVSAMLGDIRSDYSGARAMAAFIREHHLERARWVSFWYHRPAERQSDGSTWPAVEDSRRVEWPLIAANPYVADNLISCAYRGYTFMSNEFPTAGQADREIAKCAAGGKPDFLVGDDHARYFMERLGLSYGDYTRYRLVRSDSPWKGGHHYSSVVLYVRNDVYRRLFGDGQP